MWHDGHLDCLIGNELHHVADDGLCSSHGHVWMLDDMHDLPCDSALPAAVPHDACTAAGGGSGAGPTGGAGSDVGGTAVSTWQFVHEDHVDYLVGNHLHHPTEGCHGYLPDDVLATMSLASLQEEDT